MGNGAFSCLRPSGADVEGPPQLDETLGHSFCYVRSATAVDTAAEEDETSQHSPVIETSFSSISGAAVSANSSTAIPSLDSTSAATAAAAAAGFLSSGSFSAQPLQLSNSNDSGPIDRYFLSGPIERGGANSGPLEPYYSGPIGPPANRRRRRRGRSLSSFSGGGLLPRSFSERRNRRQLAVVPIVRGIQQQDGKVQWAHGRAGEDRVHVVVSEDQRWLFVGIYDGFNGPDASEFLTVHLFPSLRNLLRGLFWSDDADDEEVEDNNGNTVDGDSNYGGDCAGAMPDEKPKVVRRLWEFLADREEEMNVTGSSRFTSSISKLKQGFGSWRKDGGPIWFPKWKIEGAEKAKGLTSEVDGSGCQKKRRKKLGQVVDHGLVLDALAQALEATESEYLEMIDKAMDSNPELALTGSCLLVVLMRDDDVYVMNVGDSRALVAQYRPQGTSAVSGLEERMEGAEGEVLGEGERELVALQLSTDHNTSIEAEVLRIREEHPDDDQCIVNGRVKGRLNVTRAFGAGFLKQPKWNNLLLEIFRNKYVGTAPYITCEPSLCHHKLVPSDQFLVLSSDGLYQYLTNEEVVLHVETFMEKFPDGDPAQSLIEELLCRAAKKAGMEFHELLDIPHGERRKYHDDITVMVISLEGRIWKSSGNYL